MEMNPVDGTGKVKRAGDASGDGVPCIFIEATIGDCA